MVSLFGRGFNSLQLHDSREKVLRPERSGDFFCMHVLLFGWFTALWKSISDCFFIHEVPCIGAKFPDNEGWHKPWRRGSSRNDKSAFIQPVNHLLKTGAYIPYFFSCLMPVYFMKTQTTELRIFLTFFWQNKIAKEVWRNVKSGTTKAISARTSLPHTL